MCDSEALVSSAFTNDALQRNQNETPVQLLKDYFPNLQKKKKFVSDVRCQRTRRQKT